MEIAASAVDGLNLHEHASTLFQIDKSEKIRKKLDTFVAPCYSSADFAIDKDRGSAWGRIRITVIVAVIDPMAVRASIGRNGFERR